MTMTSHVRFTIVNIGTLSMNKFWGETERIRPTSATCTLLEAGDFRLLVDPSPAPELLEPMLFANAGLHPEDVDAVFLTHWHGDHHFGLSLFEDKAWFMSTEGLAEWQEQRPADRERFERFNPAEDHLPKGITLFPSPGHTLAHCSLHVDTQWGPLIVTGDATMTPDFFDAEEGYHNSIDFGLAAETIRHIKATARLVIPGHGNLILNL